MADKVNLEGSRLQLKRKEKQNRELLSRLTAPQHIVENRFTEHKKVEGYFQDRNAKNFYNCDRLMKIDTLYGTIQLGYDPRRRESFIFSYIKTSIYDTVSSS